MQAFQTSAKLLPLHQVLIYRTYVFLQLCQFWQTFQTELANKNCYRTSISKIRLRLLKLQELDLKARKLKTKSLNSYKDINDVFYQRLPFVLKIISTQIISQQYDNFLAGYFSINKTRKFIGRKYYQASLQKNVETYVQGCNISLPLKAVNHKLQSNLQVFLILTHHQKVFLINFVSRLSILINQKNNSYSSILVIIDWQIKTVYYKQVKISINALRPAKVILDKIIQYCD